LRGSRAAEGLRSAARLTYDALTDTYTYVWRTQKCWQRKCGMFTLKLDDGSEHTAEFLFK
jgi:hypothetical protein